MSPWLSDLFLRSQTDERLVELARSGQSRAFTAFVERYRRELLAFARSLSPGRAEDLVQQTFLSAFTALQGDTEVRHLRGWLYQILRNVAARESASWLVSDEIGEADAVAESAEHTAELRMLAVDALGAVAALPPAQHVALVQTAIQGRSRTEVAGVLGVSEGAVRQLVHRGRATLRAAVTAITPLPLVRWFANRSSGGPGLSEATLGAGTASTAGLTLKLGIGAVLATGVVASGVVTVVSSHPRAGPHASPFLTGDASAGPRRASNRSLASGLVGASRRAVGSGGSGAQHRAASSTAEPSHGPGSGSGGALSGGSPGSVRGGGSNARSSPGSGDNSGESSRGESGGSDGSGRGGGNGSDGGGTSGGSGSDGGGSSGSTSGGGGSDGGTQMEVKGATDGGSGGPDGGSSGSVTSTVGSGSDGGSGSTGDGDGSGDGGGSGSSGG